MAGGLGELTTKQARFRQYLDGAQVDRWIGKLGAGGRVWVPQRATLWAIYQLERWLNMNCESRIEKAAI